MDIVVENLAVDFDAPEGGALQALGPLSLTISANSFVCVLGPSGCGKTTLIRCLAGLQNPSSGSIHIGEQAISEPISEAKIMFQDSNLMPWRTVLDNMALPLELANIPKQDRYRQVREILPSLGLNGFENAYPGELSGGMAQRVALGRLLISQPEILLLDEPFGALDAMSREQISIDLLRVWFQKRQTVVMITHDIHEAVLLADRIIVLSSRPGQIVKDVQVPLDRPRNIDLIYSDEFIEVSKTVRASLDRTIQGNL